MLRAKTYLLINKERKKGVMSGINKLKVDRNKHNNTKQHYEITPIDEDEESNYSNTFTSKKQSNRYSSLNPDLNRVMQTTKRKKQSNGYSNNRRNASQRRYDVDFDQASTQAREIGKHNNATPDSPVVEEEIEQELKVKSQNKGKPMQPTVKNNLQGITTKNGTFKPYTLSVISQILSFI